MSSVVAADLQRDEILRRTSDAFDITVVLPRTASLAPQLQQALDREAKDIAQTFSEQAEKDHRELSGQSAMNLAPYILRIDYQPAFVSRDAISLLKVMETYTGGAHGNVIYRGMNYDLRRKAEISASELFGIGSSADTGAALKDLTDRVRAGVKAQKQAKLGKDYDPRHDDFWLDSFVLPLETMTFVPSSQPGKIGGLAFHLGPYVVGPFSEGAYHVVVPARDLAPLLTPAWRKRFGGNPVMPFRVEDPAGGMGHFALLDTPEPGASTRSPLQLTGELPDYFYRNGKVALAVLGDDGRVIAKGDVSVDRRRRPSGTAYGMLPFRGSIALPAGATGKVTVRLGTLPKTAISFPLIVTGS